MTTFASAVFPVPDRFISLGKEPAGQPGSAVTPTYTYPMTQFKPVDKITYLEDDAWRNAMAKLYNLIPGVRIADVSAGGPMFADGIGYSVVNILGDYWQSVNGAAGTTSTLSSPSSIGAGTIVVASATGFSNGGTIAVGAIGTTAEEVRTITNISGGTLTLNAALYQAHGSGGTVTFYSSGTTVAHNFALLNGGLGAGGWSKSQPPTYTYVDYTGVPASTGARQYAYACYSELALTSEATGLVMWDGKITALASAITGQTPTASPSTVIPQAAWLSTVSIAGAQVYNTAEWKATLTRKLSPKFTDSGQQDPFAIPRGYFEAGISFNFDPAQDESELNYYLQNTQPTCTLTASNGLSGSSAASIAIAAQIAAFDTAELNDSKDVFGFDETVKCVASVTNAGPSAGYSPVKVTLTNNVVNY